LISEILTILSTIVSTSLVTVLAIFYLLIKYPEKVEKWISMVARAIGLLSDRAARVHMATNIQSTIDECRKKVNVHEETLAYGVRIKWTNAEHVQTDLKENNVVVMMRPYSSQSRNLAHIVSIYVPRALLPKARAYVEPNLMFGIDHTVSKSILEGDTSALQYYTSELMDKIGNEVRSYVLKMDEVHKQGGLTRIILPELQRLNILYPKEPDKKALIDSTKLAELVYEFATKEPRADVSPLLRGAYIRMAIVQVAKPEKLIYRKTEPHLRFIEGELRRGINHFYIVSRGFFTKYSKELVEDCQRKLRLVKVHEEQYTGVFRGNLTELYCALLVLGASSA